jgi:hypothetical protein
VARALAGYSEPMTIEPHEQDPLAAGIYYALFKVVSVSDLAGPEKAIEWAQSALDDEVLLRSFAARTREVLTERGP